MTIQRQRLHNRIEWVEMAGSGMNEQSQYPSAIRTVHCHGKP